MYFTFQPKFTKQTKTDNESNKIDKESQLRPILKFQNPPNVLLNFTKLTLVKINYPKPLSSFTIWEPGNENLFQTS